MQLPYALVIVNNDTGILALCPCAPSCHPLGRIPLLATNQSHQTWRRDRDRRCLRGSRTKGGCSPMSKRRRWQERSAAAFARPRGRLYPRFDLLAGVRPATPESVSRPSAIPRSPHRHVAASKSPSCLFWPSDLEVALAPKRPAIGPTRRRATTVAITIPAPGATRRRTAFPSHKQCDGLPNS
jgi:hypothetical protein